MKVTITFGGLCLLVQREKAKSFVVLMPASHHENHMPAVVVNGVETLLAKQIISWKGLAPNQGRKPTRGFIPVSRVTGAKVDSAYLTDTNVGSWTKLAIRVELPIPSSIDAYGDSGFLKFEYPDHSIREHMVYGKAVVRYENNNHPPFDLSVTTSDGQKMPLTPDLSGNVTFDLINTPNGKIDVPVPHDTTHKPTHILAYYNLLNSPGHRPQPIVSRPYTPSPVWSTKAVTKPEAKGYVDPVQCTIGNGCDPEDPKCDGDPDCPNDPLCP